ncbi:MAG: transglutaminase N-terminal domain-containing protein [Polyangiaceae bacterium]
MSIHVALNHVTRYSYDRPISLGPQVVRLRPAPHCRTRVLSYSMRVTPAKHFLNWQQDPQANHLARLVFPERTRELVIEVDLIAEMSVINPFDFFLEPSAEKIPLEYEPVLRRELTPYLEPLPASPRFEELLASVSREPRASVDFLVDLNRRVSELVRYVIRLEPGLQTPEETLEKGSGSCRDSAWLLVALLRRLGLRRARLRLRLPHPARRRPCLPRRPPAPADFRRLHVLVRGLPPRRRLDWPRSHLGLLAGGPLPLACSAEPCRPVTGYHGERPRSSSSTG